MEVYIPPRSFEQSKLMNEITPQIFLGCQKVTADELTLECHEITHILSIGVHPLRKFPGITYEFYEGEDDQNENLSRHFDSCNKFIQNCLDAKGVVLIHCQQGISRSAAILTAYFIHSF